MYDISLGDDILDLGGIRTVTEIKMVLFNIVLMEIFDRQFAKRFRGIGFF